MKNNIIKVTVFLLSVPSFFLAILHIFIPNLGIDFISFSFFLLGYLPFFIPFIKSVELPGGTRIDLKDLEQAGKEIIGAGELRKKSPVLIEDESLSDESDPNMILVKLRIEIEKRLRKLLKTHDLDTSEKRSVKIMVESLFNANVLNRSEFSGLMDLITLGNHAVHGAEVTPTAIEWAKRRGKEILAILDEKN